MSRELEAVPPRARPRALDPEELDPGRAGRLARRALALRCPNCGAPGVVHRWLQIRPRCPGCDIMLDRGEHDFFIGAYLVNLIVAELIAAGLIALGVALFWPEVPWAWVTRVGVALMIAAPLFFFPFSRLVWLAIDLTFQPPAARDFGARLTAARPAPDTLLP
jgi:uncharacterized protein (DUF983 family)